MLPILPDAPSRTDPTNFSAKADAWVAALPAWTEAANLLEQSLQLVSTTGTSTTSKTIANGSWTLATQSGKAWVVGCYLYIASSSDPTKVMTGQVTAYNSGTGSLTVNITVVRGSGTYADWVIGLAVPDQAALNLSGGGAGSLPYQSSANTTAMLSAGSAGQVLQCNGAGSPSWVNHNGRVVAYNYILGTTFSSVSGTYSPPAGYAWVEVEIQAAGGSGAGASSAVSTNSQAGGGGQAGAYVRFVMSAAQLGASASYFINPPGSAASGGAAGNNGGNAGFAAWVAGGGSGAAAPPTASTSGSSWGAGGAGGVTSGTGTLLFSVDGGEGDPGYWFSGTEAHGGRGGDSFLGKGGRGGFRVGANSWLTSRGVGYGQGSGGGGTYGVSSMGSDYGGIGFIRITAYA